MLDAMLIEMSKIGALTDSLAKFQTNLKQKSRQLKKEKNRKEQLESAN